MSDLPTPPGRDRKGQAQCKDLDLFVTVVIYTYLSCIALFLLFSCTACKQAFVVLVSASVFGERETGQTGWTDERSVGWRTGWVMG